MSGTDAEDIILLRDDYVKKTARDRVIAMTNGMRDVCTSGFQIKARECREDCGVRAIMRRITEV